MTRRAISGWSILVVALLMGPLVLATHDSSAKGKKTAPSSPLERLGVVLDAFHVQDGEPADQMEVVHYCGEVNDDLIQCALYDSRAPGARLLGVEYVVSEKLIKTFTPEERALWHSHAYEVSSGMLHALGMPPTEEHALMTRLARTYGKTWHTWQHEDALDAPLGRPALMMSFTKDGQLAPDLVAKRDRELRISTPALKQARGDILPPKLVSGVDRGEQGLSCTPPTQRVRGGDETK